MSFSSISTISRSDLFSINFPNTFWDVTLVEKYAKWLNYDERQVITDFVGLMSMSIENVTIPDFGYTAVSQVATDANGIKYDAPTRPTESEQNLLDNTFTITLAHLDGYMSYWFALENFFKLYSGSSERKDLGSLPLRLMLEDGTVITQITFHNVLFVGQSGLNLSFPSPELDFSTFELTFQYGSFDTSFNIPQPTNFLKQND